MFWNWDKNLRVEGLKWNRSLVEKNSEWEWQGERDRLQIGIKIE